MNLTDLLKTLAGYTRLTCPHCPLQINYRGVNQDEAQRLRKQMDQHIATHTA